MKSIARNQPLYTLIAAKDRADHDTFALAVGAQHQNVNRVPEVIMIELIVSNAVQPHGCVGCNHEVESGTGWASFSEWRWQPTSSDPLFADESHAHEPARSMPFKLEKRADFCGGSILGHLFFLNIEHQTRNVQLRQDHQQATEPN